MERPFFARLSGTLQVAVGRQRCQAWIVHRAADGEVIQALKPVAVRAKNLMAGIVEIPANPGRANPRGLGFQIEHLPNGAGFPKQPPIPPRPPLPKSVAEVRNHAETESAIRGDVLMAADDPGRPAAVAWGK